MTAALYIIGMVVGCSTARRGARLFDKGQHASGLLELAFGLSVVAIILSEVL